MMAGRMRPGGCIPLCAGLFERPLAHPPSRTTGAILPPADLPPAAPGAMFRLPEEGECRAAGAHPQPEGAGRARPRAPALLRRPGHLRPRDQADLRALLDLRRPRVPGEEAGRLLDLPDRPPADGDGKR